MCAAKALGCFAYRPSSAACRPKDTADRVCPGSGLLFAVLSETLETLTLNFFHEMTTTVQGAAKTA